MRVWGWTLLLCSLTLEVAAQAPVITRIVGPTEQRIHWESTFQELPLEVVSYPEAKVSREDLRILLRAEDLLVQARREAAQFSESRALTLLLQARQLLEAHVDLPTSSHWLSEVEIALGVVASQIGRDELAHHALIRGLSLDSSRVVRAAEAAPSFVQRAGEIAASRAAAPKGWFEVRAEAAGATVYLDDRLWGNAPVVVRATVGRHVLRVEAPGYRSWGRVIDVLTGERSPLDVVLTRTSRSQAIENARQASSLEQAAHAIVGHELELWWMEVQVHRPDRALLLICDSSGKCKAPLRLQEGEPFDEVTQEVLEWPALQRELRQARSWLSQVEIEIPPGEDRPWFRKWETWVPVGLAVVAGAIGLGIALRPDPPQRFETTIDFGDLRPME